MAENTDYLGIQKDFYQEPLKDTGSSLSGSSQDSRKTLQGLRSTTVPSIRKFETGATRDVDTDKLDYEGFLSPLVLRRFAEFMHKNRYQKDGNIRDADNWQKGIPFRAYMKSGFRHFMDWWSYHRNLPIEENIEDALCALIFNASGYLHELLKEKTCSAISSSPSSSAQRYSLR